MDFSYSEEQQDVKKLAQQILGDQTENEHLRKIEQQEQRFDAKLWADLAQSGLLGVGIEGAYGGMGFGFETLCLLAEEVGRTVAPVPVIPALVSAGFSLQKFAGEEIKQNYLPDLVSGKAVLTAALMEPGNEIIAQPATTATQTEAGWQLTGSKYCVPFAETAKRILLAAQAEQGLVFLLLDPKAEGVSLNRQQVTADEPQHEIVLNNAIATELVAAGDRAEALAIWLFESTAAAYSAMAVGLCDKMMRMTASYTSERQQFGVPVATFQAVGHRAADCFIDIECLRLVSQQAVSLLDQGLDATEAVLVAKVWTGDVTHRVSQASQHLHGGIGVDRDYPLFRYCLWARQIELTAGSSAELLAVLGENIAAEFAA